MVPFTLPAYLTLALFLFHFASVAFAQPANDDLCSAQLLTIGQSCNNVPNGDNTGATTQLGEPVASCYSGFNPNSVWFRFVGPASGLVQISTNFDIGSNTDTEIALYFLPGGNCNDLSDLIEIACKQDDNAPPEIFNSTINIAPANPGGTYYISVSGWDGTEGSFCVEVSELAAPSPRPSSNDTLCNAVPLTLDAGCNAMPNGDNTHAFFEPGEVLGSCTASSSNNTVWYSFVGPNTGFVDITTQTLVGGTNVMTSVSLFTLGGDCSEPWTLSEIACATPGTNTGARLDTIPVVAGETYYVAVAGGSGGTFCVLANTVVGPTGPANDSLCNAIPIEVDSVCPGPIYTNSGATLEANEPLGSCFQLASKSVWFSFIGPASGGVEITTDLDGPGVSLTDTEVAVYRLNGTDCTDLTQLVELDCNQDGGIDISFNSIISGLAIVPGETYFIQVMGFDGESGNFCLEVRSFDRPQNDEPCQAAFVPGDGNIYDYFNVGANLEADANGTINPPLGSGADNRSWLENNLDNTVWHKFVVPSSGNVTLDLCNDGLFNTDFDTQIAVYKVGDCQDFRTFQFVGANDDVDCFGPSGGFASRLSLSCLTAGDTLWAVVDGWNGDEGNYGISVTPQPGSPSLSASPGFLLPPVCGEPDGILSALATGGNGSYEYRWSNGDSVEVLTGLSEGTYVLAVKDGCDSTFTTEFELTRQRLTADAGMGGNFCQSIDIQLGGNPSVQGGNLAVAKRAIAIGLQPNQRDLIRFETQNPTDVSTINTGYGSYFAGDLGFDGNMYVLSSDQKVLIAIDTATGISRQIGAAVPDPFHDWSGLALNPQDSVWYAISTDGQSSSLYHVDPDSATIQRIGTFSLTNPLWLAINEAGKAYVLDGFLDQLFELGLTDSSLTELGPIGFNAHNVQDADFDPLTGYLHLAAYNLTTQMPEYRIVDVTQGGASTFIDTLPRNEIGAFAISGQQEDYKLQWTGNGSLTDSLATNPLFGYTGTEDTTFTFVLTVEDACGTVANDSVTYMLSGGMADVQFINTPQVDTALTTVEAFPQGGIPPYRYLWSTGDSTATITVSAAGSYQVTVFDAAGCSIVASTDVTVPVSNDLRSAIGTWTVFPNPFKETLTLQRPTGSRGPISLAVIDAQGKTILKQAYPQGISALNHTIDLASYPAGIYVVKLETLQGTQLLRVVKK